MLKLNENSLFAILLRSHWWYSAIAAAIIFGLVRIWLHWGYALFAAAPFIIIGGYTLWKQLQRPSAARIASTLEKARGLSREEFSARLEAGFRREGYGVAREGEDIRITRNGRVTLVMVRRWKAVRTGVEPLREFAAATRDGGAHELAYVAAGEVTDTARAFAAEKRIRLVQEEELARLLR